MQPKHSALGTPDKYVSWRPPDRHVLIIVNFQDLADLTSRTQQLPATANADFLDAACRVHLDALDENSLFTWCRHFDHREALETPMGNLCNLPSHSRHSYPWHCVGATRLRPMGRHRPAGQDHRPDLGHLETSMARSLDSMTSTDPLPRSPRRPFTWHLSCHRFVPGVILP